MMLWVMAATHISGASMMTSCSKEDEVLPDNKKTIVLNCEKQQLNTADITAPATPVAVRMRLAGKRE